LRDIKPIIFGQRLLLRVMKSPVQIILSCTFIFDSLVSGFEIFILLNPDAVLRSDTWWKEEFTIQCEDMEPGNSGLLLVGGSITQRFESTGSLHNSHRFHDLLEGEKPNIEAEKIKE
jgi:hypothetical protein